MTALTPEGGLAAALERDLADAERKAWDALDADG